MCIELTAHARQLCWEFSDSKQVLWQQYELSICSILVPAEDKAVDSETVRRDSGQAFRNWGVTLAGPRRRYLLCSQPG